MAREDKAVFSIRNQSMNLRFYSLLNLLRDDSYRFDKEHWEEIYTQLESLNNKLLGRVLSSYKERNSDQNNFDPTKTLFYLLLARPDIHQYAYLAFLNKVCSKLRAAEQEDETQASFIPEEFWALLTFYAMPVKPELGEPTLLHRAVVKNDYNLLSRALEFAENFLPLKAKKESENVGPIDYQTLYQRKIKLTSNRFTPKELAFRLQESVTKGKKTAESENQAKNFKSMAMLLEEHSPENLTEKKKEHTSKQTPKNKGG